MIGKSVVGKTKVEKAKVKRLNTYSPFLPLRPKRVRPFFFEIFYKFICFCEILYKFVCEFETE